ncbi:MAG: 4-hydroxy-tetrahydrodipicolinate synthase [Bacteroidota bacterium]
MERLFGTGVALVTPFDKKLKIDFQSLKKLLDFTAAKGADYYVVLGTTGESATLSASEKLEVLQFVKHNNPSNLPIVYGIGGNNTEDVISTIHRTDLQGIEAILSVSPYYNKPTQAGIIEHYTAIGNESPVPVIMYNVPGRTGSNIEADTTLELAGQPNIIGIKEASGDLVQAMKIVKYKPDNFMLISGDDMLTTALYSMGAVGVISVLANAFSNIFQEVKQAAASGDFRLATSKILTLLEINPLMYEQSNPVGLKEILRYFGICENHVRLPLLPASKDLSIKIEAQLKAL